MRSSRRASILEQAGSLRNWGVSTSARSWAASGYFRCATRAWYSSPHSHKVCGSLFPDCLRHETNASRCKVSVPPICLDPQAPPGMMKALGNPQITPLCDLRQQMNLTFIDSPNSIEQDFPGAVLEQIPPRLGQVQP